MSFNPIIASKNIDDTYKNYMKSTFYIRDEVFRKQYFAKVDELEFANGPYLDCVDSFELGVSLKDFAARNLISKSFETLFKDDKEQYTRPLYKHQEKALELALQDNNLVVTTGTGSGKTECFLYPILDYLLREEENSTLGPGVRVLLLYPMNALANDQMKRLRRLLANRPSITFGSYTGETEESHNDAIKKYKTLHKNKEPLKNELISREEMKQTPPNILVTNYAMLEYLLIRPKDNVFFGDPNLSKFWKYIVLDEAHVYSGASGMEVSILLRRLYHKLPNNEKIRWILTSATLGDETKNNDIVKFATSLCASQYFSPISIVRAERKNIEPDPLFTGSENLYKDIVNLIFDKADEEEIKEKVYSIINSYLNINLEVLTDKSYNLNRIIYDIFSHDSLYLKIRSVVTNKGATLLDELVKKVNVSEKALIDFIQIASFSIKNNGKLLDSRYHHFIRTLEGAYVSFFPKKTLSLIPIRTVSVDGLKYKAFKLSVCQYCGEIYLEGVIKNGFFNQEESGTKKYFMIVDNEFLKLDEEDAGVTTTAKEKIKRTYNLCTRCGSIGPFSSSKKCSCDDKAQILLYEPKIKSEDNLLHQCGFCKFTNTKGSVIRGFYLGQDGSTSVVAEALYEEIPEVEIGSDKYEENKVNRFVPVVREENKKTKRLLIFSDSRQEAAYFATYFQYTYEIIYRRRLMMDTVRKLLLHNGEEYKDGIPLNHLAERMYKTFEKFDGSNSSPTYIKKEVWKTIINEFKDQSRNSLHNIGWLEYELSDKLLIRQDYANDELKLYFNRKEINNIAKFILRFCMQHGALLIPKEIQESMTAEDWGFFEFSSKEPVIHFTKSSQKSSEIVPRPLISETTNSISQYLSKVFNIDRDTANLFIKDIFDGYFHDDTINILVDSNLSNGSLKIDPSAIVILSKDRHPINHFRCNICGKITSININDKCPSFRCSGTLAPFNFSEADTKSYFINQYGDNVPLDQIVIKEHTAQLSHQRAQEYQQKFVKGDINILSCTTTFEMGVDVGDLETVFMKNIPPKPSNYIQRAGRAGRRLSTSAFSLTFCRLSPHDFYYFKFPKNMINGVIDPPIFKIDNPKIVQRHIFAILLATYWRELFPDKNKIEDFFSEESFSKIIDFLKNQSHNLMAYIKKVVPESITNEIPHFLSTYVDELLPRVRQLYKNDVSSYEDAIKEEDSKEVKNFKLLDWLDRIKKSYENELLLTFYSRNNLIPKYGFPVDTVTLFVNTLSPSTSFKDSSTLDLQRDLIQAISDYAPDSEIIADGNLYKSRYVKLPYRKDDTWKPQLIHLCTNYSCGKIDITPYKMDDLVGKSVCIHCGEKSVEKMVMIIPAYGFMIEPNVVKANTKRPMKSPKTEFYYLGNQGENVSEPKIHQYHDTTISIVSTLDDELLIMNKLDFYICEACGYAEIGSGGFTKTKSHKTHRGKNCNHILERRTLGHKFKTDVVLLSTDKKLPREKALTIMYALLEGCSKYFDISRDDIDGCISYQSYASEGGKHGTTFVLFDSVPGGAGNVKRIYEADKNSFDKFIFESYNRVNSCDCGEDGNSVCYKCLCNFRNQHHQEKMERKYAIDFLGSLI